MLNSIFKILLRLCKKRRETDRFFETIFDITFFEKKKNTIFMWEIINKIKCKIFVCCKSKCSLNAELDSPEALEEKKHYDYFSKKQKQFSSTRSL